MNFMRHVGLLVRRNALAVGVGFAVSALAVAIFVEATQIRATADRPDEASKNGARCAWSVQVIDRQFREIVDNEKSVTGVILTLQLQAKLPKPLTYARGKLLLIPPDGSDDIQLWDHEIVQLVHSGDMQKKQLAISLGRVQFAQWIKDAPLNKISFVMMVNGVQFADGEKWSAN